MYKVFPNEKGVRLYLKNILVTEHLNCVTRHLHILAICIDAYARDEYPRVEGLRSILQRCSAFLCHM